MGMWPGAYWLKSSLSDALLADIVCNGGGGGGSGEGGREGVRGVMWHYHIYLLPDQPKNLVRQLKLPSEHVCNKCRVHFDNEVHLARWHKKFILQRWTAPK